MFSTIQNRQKDLSVEEFLKISSIGFKENECITVKLYGNKSLGEPSESKDALIKKFIDLLKSDKLPARLSIGIYVIAWRETFDYLPLLLDTLNTTKCKHGFSLTLSGIAWDKTNFTAIKLIAACNPYFIEVDFIEGNNCHYMPCDETKKHIQDITNLCVKNDYALRFPNLKGFIDVYCNAKNSGINKSQIINLINSLDQKLEEQVEVNFQVEKSLKKI